MEGEGKEWTSKSPQSPSSLLKNAAAASALRARVTFGGAKGRVHGGGKKFSISISKREKLQKVRNTRNRREARSISSGLLKRRKEDIDSKHSTSSVVSEESKNSSNRISENVIKKKQFIETLQLSHQQRNELNQGGFFYLRRRTITSPFFDLILCSKKEAIHAEEERIVSKNSPVYRDYFTVSSAGVTWYEYGTIIKAGSREQFYPMKSWQRCYEIYKVLREFSVFKKFRVWKRFQWWRKLIRSKKRRRSIRALTGKLQDFDGEKHVSSETDFSELHINPKSLGCISLATPLQKCFYSLRRSFLAILQQNFMTIEPEITYTISKFEENQKDCEINLRSSLIEIRDNLANQVHEAGNEYLQMNKKIWSIYKEMEKSDNAFREGGGSSTVNSTFVEKAAVRLQCKELVRFTRVAGLQLQDTIENLICNATERFYNHLKLLDGKNVPQHLNALSRAHRRRAAALLSGRGGSPKSVDRLASGTGTPRTRHYLYKATRFRPLETDTSPNSNSSLLLPPIPKGLSLDTQPLLILYVNFPNNQTKVRLITEELSQNTINPSQLIDNLLVSAAKQVIIDPLHTHQLFASWFRIVNDKSGEQISTKKHVCPPSSIRTFQKFRQEIRLLISSAMERAAAFARVFEPFQKMLKENREIFNELNLAYREEGVWYRNAEASVFKNLIERFHNQIVEFEKIPIETNLGIFQVNSSNLRKLLIPSPIECLQMLHTLLPTIIIESSEILLNRIKSVTPRYIGRIKIRTADEFCSIMQSVDVAKQLTVGIGEKFYRIRDIRDLFLNLKNQKKGRNNEIQLNESRLEEIFLDLENALDHLHDSISIFETSRSEQIAFFSQVIKNSTPQLITSITNCRSKVHAAITSDPDAKPSEALEYISSILSEANLLSKKVKNSNSYLRMFGESPLLHLEETREKMMSEITAKQELWNAIYSWKTFVSDFMNSRLCDLKGKLANNENENGKTIMNEVAFYLRRALHAQRSVMDMAKDTRNEERKIN
eukprot:g3853.t1